MESEFPSRRDDVQSSLSVVRIETVLSGNALWRARAARLAVT
jgi:hypothetical protein